MEIFYQLWFFGMVLFGNLVGKQLGVTFGV